MSEIAVVTTTFYNDLAETRFHLACQLVGDAVGTGYDVIVVDGSPNTAIGEALKRIGASVYKQIARGMGPSRRELFMKAEEDDCLPEYFVWTEPEKPDVIRSIPKLVAPLALGEAEIVILERTEASWSSYPNYQVESERQANAVYAEVTGRNFDPMSGPMAWTRKVNRYFSECNPKERFGAADTYIQHIAPLLAMADGCRVASVPVDFYYPRAQFKEELTTLSDAMVAKRTRQLAECTEAYRLAADALRLKRK